MCILRILRAPALAGIFLSMAMTAAMPASASLRLTTATPANAVQVSVSFNSQIPLADTREAAVAALQKAGRSMLYRMASKECAVLRETIAATCRLTRLNVSCQLRQPDHGQASIYLSGSAQFAITLKKADGAQ